MSKPDLERFYANQLLTRMQKLHELQAAPEPWLPRNEHPSVDASSIRRARRECVTALRQYQIYLLEGDFQASSSGSPCQRSAGSRTVFKRTSSSSTSHHWTSDCGRLAEEMTRTHR